MLRLTHLNNKFCLWIFKVFFNKSNFLKNYKLSVNKIGLPKWVSA